MITTTAVLLALIATTGVATDHIQPPRDAPASFGVEYPEALPLETGPSAVQYIVIPHEDDEFETWGMVEDRDTFKVFIVLGNGEQTAFCVPNTTGLQAEFGERDPGNTVGRWTPECAAARINSWTQYFTDMHASNPLIPGNFVEQAPTRQFPTGTTEVCRKDDLLVNAGPCVAYDHGARVWTNAEQDGVLIAFNIGEGDETAAEVQWAISTVLAYPAEFSIPTDLPTWGIVGAYSNVDNPDCFQYLHPDHLAVRDALRYYDYDVPVQGSAVCATDADATVFKQVSEESMSQSFELDANGGRWGAHGINYGWLHESTYPLDPHGQAQIFHGAQAFSMHRPTAPAAQ